MARLGRRGPRRARVAVARLTHAGRRAVRRAGVEVGPPGGRLLPVGLRAVHVPPTLPPGPVRVGDPVRIDVRRIVTAYGFSYADDGWHPYWATMRACLADPDLGVADSPLQWFFDAYQPRTAATALFPEEGGGGPHPLDLVAARYVPRLWTSNARALRTLAAETARRPVRRWNMNFGPADPDRIQAEFDRCVTILDSIRRHGYRPERYPGGVIDGFFLVDGEDWRFVPTEGQHRLGALRALGMDDVVVRPRAGLTSIRRQDLPRWTPQHGRPYPLAVATQLFDRYFEHRGRDAAVGAVTAGDTRAGEARP